MPIYQYKATDEAKSCKACKDGFEIIQSMKDKELKTCPECNSPVRKVPSLVSGGVPMMSDGNLRDKGFKKLVRRDKGVYEQTL